MHRKALFRERFRNPIADQELVFDNQDPNRRNVTECRFHGGSPAFRLERNASQGHLFKLRKILVKLSFVNR